MLNLYKDKKPLDSRCEVQFGLSSEILMENAGVALKLLIERLTHQGSVITIVCGGGDNGGDGYVLARHLIGKYRVRIYEAKKPKSLLCIKQYERVLALGVEFVKKFLPCDVIVDCFIGSGLQSDLDIESKKIILAMQEVGRIKIACDIPSGVKLEGSFDVAFKADYTMAMGGLNYGLFSDFAKDYVGKIEIGELGISSEKYAVDSHIKLLEAKDLDLPRRKSQNSHKGDFGHLSVCAGTKSGAGNLSAIAGLKIGAGSVGIFGNLHPYFAELMYEEKISPKTNACCIGMGMGEKIPKEFLELDFQIPCVLDADILRQKEVVEIFERREHLILTPHCGEFLSLWENCGFEKLDKDEFLGNKIKYLLQFCAKYPHLIVLLKGANVLIAKRDKVFINPLGNVALAKAGSGDILAGIIGGLLAQGMDLLSAAIQGSLVHSLCAKNFEDKNYALMPLGLLEEVGKIK